MTLALEILGGVLVYILFVTLLLGLFKAARRGDEQQDRAFHRSYDRDEEWPWPPKRKDAA